MKDVVINIEVKNIFVLNVVDCSCMTSSDQILSQNVDHKAALSVTEAGVQAGAVSGVTAEVRLAHTLVKFDKPFLFFIRHRDTGVSLFLEKSGVASVMWGKGRICDLFYDKVKQ